MQILDDAKRWVSCDKADKRLEICKGCEHFKKNICAKCGCFMPIKVNIPWSKCPENHWGE